MASTLERILQNTLQKSDSQKAFSPWWEDVQDKLLYTLMILGMIALPFNMVSNTPVECTYDQAHPSFNLSTGIQRKQVYKGHHLYLRKYCTMNYINDAMVFLPFLFILLPLPLVGLGRMFLRYFKVEKKIDCFYKLLLQESLDREDVEAMEKENLKDVHELLQMFRKSNGVYEAFLSRSMVQFMLGLLLCCLTVWIFLFALSGPDLHCSLFNKHYICVVPLANFYCTIVLVAMVASHLYVICALYNLTWLFFPTISPFRELMTKTKQHIDYVISREKSGYSSPTFTRTLTMVDCADPFFDVFFDDESKDLGLLITLLAARNGVAEGLRILSLFDKEYQKLWKPLGVLVKHDDVDLGVIHVSWEDAPLADYIHSYKGRTSKMRVEYTVEFVPNSDTETPLKNYVYVKDTLDHMDKKVSYKYEDTFYGVDVRQEGQSLEEQKQVLKKSMSIIKESGEEKSKDKTNISKCGPKIMISTEVNGRTISQTTEKVPAPPLLLCRKKDSPV